MRRPSPLTEQNISFQFVNKKIFSSSTLILCGLIALGAIILFFSLFFWGGISVLGPTNAKDKPKSLMWRRTLVSCSRSAG